MREQQAMGHDADVDDLMMSGDMVLPPLGSLAQLDDQAGADFPFTDDLPAFGDGIDFSVDDTFSYGS